MRPANSVALTLLAAFVVWPATGALAQTPFVDIAPCHWAAEAVGKIAGQPQVEPAQARNSVYLAENSVRQVFEGLRCETPDWSLAFLADAPDDWPQVVPEGPVAVQAHDVRIDGNRGVVTVSLRAAWAGRELDRSGEVDVVFRDGKWLVEYASLAALDLPFFP